MKRIGSIRGVPVVEGNPNEITKNQILYKESNKEVQLSKRDSKGQLNTITGSNSDNGDGLVYYKINNPLALELLVNLPIVSAIITQDSQDKGVLVESIFLNDSGYEPHTVNSYIMLMGSNLNVLGVSFLKKETYIVNTLKEEPYQILPKGGVKEKLKELLNLSVEDMMGLDLAIQEISKEEYYALAINI